MARIDIYNLNGAKVGTMGLADEIFGAVNEDLLWEAVKHYRAGQRAGTHATKNRWRVSGSGKRLWRKKGTGRARIGSIRSPLWRHGGTVHGPKPRSYAYRFPRQKLRGALRSALSARLEENRITVVDEFALGSHKTKEFDRILRGLAGDQKVLIVDSEENHNLRLSSRNLPKAKMVPGTGVNIYDVVNHQMLIFSKRAILQVQEVLS